MTFNFTRMATNAVANRYRFVCSPEEFRFRYGKIETKEEAEKVLKYVCLCKDGMIRPR